MDSDPIHCPSPAKKMKCSFFGLHSTSDDWPGWVMDSNPIHLPSLVKKMKCSFLDYIQLLMIGQAGWRTQTPSTTPLQPKKWNPHLWITLNFWWSAGLVDGLKPHLRPLSSQKNEMLIFWIMFNFWWSAGLVNGLKPHPPPLFSQKSEMLIFVLHSTSDVGQTGQWTWISSTTPLQPKIWNAHFWVTFNFWWLVGLFDELKPHLPPLCSQ